MANTQGSPNQGSGSRSDKDMNQQQSGSGQHSQQGGSGQHSQQGGSGQQGDRTKDMDDQRQGNRGSNTQQSGSGKPSTGNTGTGGGQHSGGTGGSNR